MAKLRLITYTPLTLEDPTSTADCLGDEWAPETLSDLMRGVYSDWMGGDYKTEVYKKGVLVAYWLWGGDVNRFTAPIPKLVRVVSREEMKLL